jgi:hypothetical protein
MKTTSKAKTTVYLPGAGRVALTPNVLDVTALNAFSYGQCHALAIALAERLELPLRVVLSTRARLRTSNIPENEELPDRVVARHWGHAVVELSPGKYLDVKGIRSAKELIDMNACEPSSFIAPTSRRQLCELSYLRSGVRPNIDVARQFVDAVIDSYL